MDALKSKTTTVEKRKGSILFVIGFVAIIVVLLIAFNIISKGEFLEIDNIMRIVEHSIFPAFMAWGFSFLFACGYNDLSLGAVMVICAFITMIAGNLYGIPGVVIGGLVSGTLLVFINFNIFAFTKIPSWIAGLSLAMIYEAISIFIQKNPATKEIVSRGMHPEIRVLGKMPANIILVAIGIVAAYLIYTKTSVGLNIRAIGGDVRVAKALGISVTKTLLLVGLISGIFISIASIIDVSYLGDMTIKTGLTSVYVIFEPLAIVLLAQILVKHININIGIPICAFILYAIFSMLAFLGVPTGTLQDVVLGAFLIIFGVIGRRGYTGVVK